MQDTSTIWLEVTNVRSSKTEGEITVQIQVKGDRAEREPEWWNVNEDAYIDSDAAKTYRTLSENLDKKRIVLAALGAVDKLIAKKSVAGKPGIKQPKTGTLECKHLRIQYAESASR